MEKRVELSPPFGYSCGGLRCRTKVDGAENTVSEQRGKKIKPKYKGA